MTSTLSSRSRWVLLVVALGVMALAGWAVFASTTFAARSVTVEGARQVSPQQVRDAADVSMELPLMRLPLDQIAQRVEQLDAVAAVSVERDWPDAVRIVISERTPVTQVRTSDGFGLVGSDGRLYRTEPELLRTLPLLTSVWPSGAETVTDDAIGDSTTAGFTVAAAMPEAMRRQVADIDSSDLQRIEVTLDGGAVVQWGTSTDSRRKSEVLQLLLARRASTYDVSVPDAPAWSG